MTRQRLPATRHGQTHKIRLGATTLYVTVNRDDAGHAREMLVKADNGHQGQADVLAETASLYLQRGGELEELLRHWRGHRYDPQGGPGQGASIPDAIARRLSKCMNNCA
jgi:hypothetical protein